MQYPTWDSRDISKSKCAQPSQDQSMADFELKPSRFQTRSIRQNPFAVFLGDHSDENYDFDGIPHEYEDDESSSESDSNDENPRSNSVPSRYRSRSRPSTSSSCAIDPRNGKM